MLENKFVSLPSHLKTTEPMEVHRGSGTMCNPKTSKVISRTDPMILNFDMHSWDSFKEIIRNVETIGADFIHGKGTPFTIRLKGVNKINHNYNKINNLIL